MSIRRVVTTLLLIALAVAPGRVAGAQDSAYVPATEFPNGRQVIALYFGAHWCKPCNEPEVKRAVARMKALVAAQAKDSGAATSLVAVALDRDLTNALAYIQPLGAFDEYVIGNDLASLAAERFVWGDSLAEKAVPEIIVLERTVRMSRQTGLRFGPTHVLRRISGRDEIVPWVEGGAHIWGGAAPTSATDATDVRGVYTSGFETSAFRPCGATAAWWVPSLRGVPAVRAAIDAKRGPRRMGYPTVYVRWRGTLTEHGRYGHLGAYERQFTPVAVVTVASDAPADCR